MELEVERRRDVGVRILFEGEVNVESDSFSAGFMGAEIGRFHDAGAAAGGDNEAVTLGGDLEGPFGEHVGEAARILIVASHVDGGLGAFDFRGALGGGSGVVVRLKAGQKIRGILATLDAGGTEEDDRVLNLLAAEAREGLAVFGEQAQNSAIRAVEKRFVLIGERRGFQYLISHK